jgi:hypothetical protein
MKQLKKNKFVLTIAITAFMLLYSVVLSAEDFPGEVLKARRSVKGNMMFSHIQFLASKYCRGRETGDYGMDIADEYITSVFKGANIQPAGDNGSYF